MPLTTAERQRAYRERHLGPDGERVRRELIWSAAADAKLRRIARHRGLTIVAMLEELVKAVKLRSAP
jgi:hypothetical protein